MDIDPRPDFPPFTDEEVMDYLRVLRDSRLTVTPSRRGVQLYVVPVNPTLFDQDA